jgi:hypothetical protein
MLKRSMVFIVCAALVAVAASCATFTKDAYQSLSVSFQAYDATMRSVSDLYREGRVSEAQKRDVIAYGNLYVAAHNNAVQSLANYERTGAAEDKEAYLDCIADLSKRLSQLINYAQPILGGN